MHKPKIEVRRWDDGGSSGGDANSVLGGLETLAWLLDDCIRIPGTGFRIGFESILGLIPVLGDLIGAAISTYILFISARLGVPRVTLLRMGFNIAIDSLLGMVPIVGDIFDFAWKSNLRNVELLRGHIINPSGARRSDWAFAAVFILAVLAGLCLLGWGAWAFVHALAGIFAI